MLNFIFIWILYLRRLCSHWCILKLSEYTCSYFVTFGYHAILLLFSLFIIFLFYLLNTDVFTILPIYEYLLSWINLFHTFYFLFKLIVISRWQIRLFFFTWVWTLAAFFYLIIILLLDFNLPIKYCLRKVICQNLVYI